MPRSKSNKSEYFSLFSDKIEDRLDINFNNPRYGIIEKLLSRTKYAVTRLSEDAEHLDTTYLVSITSGRTPKGIRFRDLGIRFIGGTSIYDEKVDLNVAPFISKEMHEGVLKGSKLEKDDVLVTIAGFGIGRCAVYDHEEECNANQAVAILRVNKSNINPKYLVKYFHSAVGQLHFEKLQHIAGQPNINLDEILQIKIILPKENEQEEILKAISPLEDRIQMVEGEIEQIKKDALRFFIKELGFEVPDRLYDRKWFFKTGGDVRSPYFAVLADSFGERLHYLFYDPEIDIIPKFKKNYSITTLGKIGHPKKGEQPEYTKKPSEILAIKTIDLKDEYIDYQRCLHVTEECFSKFPATQVKRGDVLVACTGYVSMGKVDFYDSDSKAMAAQDLCIVRLEQDYDPLFLTYLLRSPIGKVQFEKWWIGSSGQIHLEPEDLSNFVIPDSSNEGVPLAKQGEIAQKVTQKLTKLKELRIQKEQLIEQRKTEFEKQIGICNNNRKVNDVPK